MFIYNFFSDNEYKLLSNSRKNYYFPPNTFLTGVKCIFNIYNTEYKLINMIPITILSNMWLQDFIFDYCLVLSRTFNVNAVAINNNYYIKHLFIYINAKSYMFFSFKASPFYKGEGIYKFTFYYSHCIKISVKKSKNNLYKDFLYGISLLNKL